MTAQSNKPKKRGFRPNITWFWIVVIVIILGSWLFSGEENKPVRSNWNKVSELVRNGDVERIVIVNKDVAKVFLREGAAEYYRNTDPELKSLPDNGEQIIFTIGSVESFENSLAAVESEAADMAAAQAAAEIAAQENDTLAGEQSEVSETDDENTTGGESVDRTGRESVSNVSLTASAPKQKSMPARKKVIVEYEKEGRGWSDILISILPWIFFIGIWILMWRGMSRGGGGGAGIMNVGKARAQVYDKENSRRITFKDVAGLEEAKVEIMEIVDFLKKKDKYIELGAKIPKGALLVGPPGTGKTLLAKAVAGEANVPFLSMSGSDFVEMFVGVGASRVRDLFEQAKQKAPCILFIDEIDAIGRARGKNAGFSGNDERENTLNQLLTEMDGFQTNAGVIVLAATNRADILDKALMRAGRFDRQIEVGLPDVKEREEIFNVHLRPLKLDPQLDRTFLAKQTPGFSGADIANVCNEAALIAARHGKKAVSREDFLAAIDRIIGGLERKNKIITDEEKRTIAYHEAGHATVSWILENASPLIKVTIIPRGKALGAAWYLPEERQITTREHLLDELAATLGGRASEELTFGHLSTGALNDLERVTKQAYAMVAFYGMSDKVGTISYYDSTGQSDMSFTKPYSERTAQEIDDEVKRIIDEAYAMAKSVLTEHSDGLKELAELLLAREVVFTEDVERIFGKRKKDILREQREAEEAAKREDAGAEVLPAAEDNNEDNQADAK
ncbi:MAG: ATP-dependent zinc metalloprotease FtsH [Alistipes sp.]|nr:ATP-dependent zinc metalloprotease FtsH [Alistipes sp.]